MDRLKKHLEETWARMNEQTVRLIPDLYEDEDDVWDETEIRSNFIGEEDLEREFTVKTMTPEEAKTLETGRSKQTVWDVFQNYANREQIKLVKHKLKNWDDNRIVLIMGKTLLDGNHQVAAGIMGNKPIKYIDLEE